MLIVVSPAKKLDMEPAAGFVSSEPAFAARAQELAGIAGKLDTDGLRKLMGISENLAKLNADRFANFGEMETKQAALAFAGDTYQGLEAKSLDEDEMAWAQDHLRILSGLYGLLRPLDRIEPYRLEMGSRLETPRGKSLYDYWGDTLAQALNAQAEKLGTETLVNCASQEYFGAVSPDALKLRVITPVFMEEKNGEPKVVSFYAKRARGAMARFIVQKRLTDPDALRDFDSGGYEYRADLSEGDRIAFVRPG
ncbi:peroxide stress protein YaaA [Roseovarius sp. SCSIO 43702]|uniref:peroxide stress protein YaaA n=1 Tax=Roseovarius sp. SCSIO 43702 TaxID=2823043 RepID=UPI001C738DB2|nr:peroxide stress protein YaaA [Roseovarius sp. SCSIO 43702]QYX56960.1 peroxide stress protein YaaA [Roseovarius sp. SCSIO 43702]